MTGLQRCLTIGSLLMLISIGGGARARDGERSDGVPPREHLKVGEVAAGEQAPFIDGVLPELKALLAEPGAVRDRVAGGLSVDEVEPALYALDGDEYRQRERERLTEIINASVAACGRYEDEHEAGEDEGDEGEVDDDEGELPLVAPNVTVLPRSGVVLAEFVYPAPAASDEVIKGKLTVTAWVCPDRASAVALYWLRAGGVWAVAGRLPAETEHLAERIEAAYVDGRLEAAEVGPPDALAGEASYRFVHRTIVSVRFEPRHGEPPADRLSFIRGNVVVEAATYEYTPDGDGRGKWFFEGIDRSEPELEFLLNAIDGALTADGEREGAGEAKGEGERARH